MNSVKKGFILFNIIFWAFLGIILLIGIMPKTPLKIGEEFKKIITIIFPEKWHFFTKDPNVKYIFVLEKKGGTYHFHDNFPNSKASNLYGLVNNQRATGLEYGMISNKISQDLWYENDTGENVLEVITQDTFKTLRIQNPVIESSLEGEYVFLEIEPLPYSWRRNFDQFQMPSRFVKIKITKNEDNVRKDI